MNSANIALVYALLALGARVNWLPDDDYPEADVHDGAPPLVEMPDRLRQEQEAWALIKAQVELKYAGLLNADQLSPELEDKLLAQVEREKLELAAPFRLVEGMYYAGRDYRDIARRLGMPLWVVFQAILMYLDIGKLKYWDEAG